jgi:MinD superfamily P-loop ATPase
MRIAVASGKGGTGKTTVAVNLAKSLAGPVVLADCDVEEPNAHLFLRPHLTGEEEVGLLIPEVDAERCVACGTCADVCVYHAIAVVGGQVLVFPELCHGCGSCAYNCPEGAIREVLRPTGELAWGTVDVEGAAVRFGQGTMNVGEAMATPIIRQLKERGIPRNGDALVLLDAPPGNACPVVETMRGSDFVLLVTEPTPFGLHDLRVAVEVAREELGLPVGVVVNRDGFGDAGVDAFCAEADVPILLRIPLERRIAEAYAEGLPLVEAFPEYRAGFLRLYEQIEAGVAGG